MSPRGRPPAAALAATVTSVPSPTGEPRARLGTDVHGLPKPLLRGRLHAAALVVSVPAGVAVVRQAAPGRPMQAAAVYAVTLVALFAASSSYHCLGRTLRSQHLLRRVDHAAIFLLIAGSYTPVFLLVVPSPWGGRLLALVWVIALTGAVSKLTRFHRVRYGVALYLATSWAGLVTVPLLPNRLAAGSLALVAVGALALTAGAVSLALRRPDPWPTVFGYHEVWHSLVIVGCACHYAVIAQIVATS